MGAARWLAAMLVAAAPVLGGCSRDHSLSCEPTERYARAGSTAPVRVPDDLTPPDETDALQLPSVDAATAASEKPCLESPPTFTPTGRGRGAAQQRPPPAAPPAPAAGGDREIGN